MVDLIKTVAEHPFASAFVMIWIYITAESVMVDLAKVVRQWRKPDA